MSEIRDESLWESGKRKIEWVRQNMSLLRSVEEDFKRDQPFKGLKVALSIHLEAKTAYLFAKSLQQAVLKCTSQEAIRCLPGRCCGRSCA